VKRNVGRRIVSALPLILAIALIMFCADLLGWFDRFEAPGLDLFARLDAPLHWRTVRIVGIDDADYARPDLFNATSPLRAEVVRRLIDAVAKSGARVIGVDLDTSGAAWKTITIDPSWPPIVWAANVPVLKGGELGVASTVLGGRGPTRTKDRAAAALVTSDFDGVVRRYRNRYAGTDAFGWAVVRRYCEAVHWSTECARVPRDAARAAEAPLLHVLGNPSDEGTDYLPARDLLDAIHSPNWAAHDPYAGKIVLLGGFFAAGRDSHVTPVRPMQGVELIAQAIENELGGAATPPLNGILAIALDVLAGIGLVVLSTVLDFFPAVVVSLIGIPLFAVAVSFFAFSSSVLWFDFVPMLVGVFLHELYDHAQEYTKLRAELAELRPSA
jgi:hypothetical protein